MEGRRVTKSVRRRRGKVAQISCEDRQGWMVVREQALILGVELITETMIWCIGDGVVWGGVIGKEGTMVLGSCHGTRVMDAERG